MAGTPQVHIADSATRIELSPTGATRSTGLIFYPGAKVDPRAYVPNLTPIAAAGYPVIILKVPYNIAFAGRGAALRAIDAHPAVMRWVVGGHSLGGVVASSVAGSNDPRVRGLLLWASYPSSTLADRTSLQVTSISGSNDGLATPAKIDAAKAKLPPDTRYVVIEGGIHSFFGDYGLQSGDGTPSVSRHTAQQQIQAATLDLMHRVAKAPS
jgi:dienelactone hydrolase